MGPLGDGGAEGAVKDDKAFAEKLSEFFAWVFTADGREIPRPEPVSFGDRSEELPQTEVSREEVWGQMDKLNGGKSPGPGGIHPRVGKDSKVKLQN